MPNRALSIPEKRYIRDNLSEVLSDVEELMALVTHMLTELSHQIGIVLTPVIGETTLKAIYFLKLSGQRALCVLESTSGLVEHRVVDTLNPISREDLIQISNYLNDNYSGLSLREIRDRLLALMADERERIDRLLAEAITLAQQALTLDEWPGLLVEGTEAVLSQPELSDISRVRRLLEKFTDKAKLVRMLDQLIGGRGTRVIIGEDSDLTSDLDFSLVATNYGTAKTSMGTLGIFGPSRMEYEKVVPLVGYLGRALSETLDLAE
jgi:heat-inducible transcriptional repressor